MKKLLVLALLPLSVACRKSHDMNVMPNDTAQQPVMKTTGGNSGTSASFQLQSFSVSKLQPYPQGTKITWKVSGETYISQCDVEISGNSFTTYSTLTTVPSSNSNSTITHTYNHYYPSFLPTFVILPFTTD